MSLNRLHRCTLHQIVNVKFSLNRTGHDMAIGRVKNHIDSKIANIVAFVLVDLGPC